MCVRVCVCVGGGGGGGREEGGGGGGVVILDFKTRQLKKYMFNIFTGPLMHSPVIFFQCGWKSGENNVNRPTIPNKVH